MSMYNSPLTLGLDLQLICDWKNLYEDFVMAWSEERHISFGYFYGIVLSERREYHSNEKTKETTEMMMILLMVLLSSWTHRVMSERQSKPKWSRPKIVNVVIVLMIALHFVIIFLIDHRNQEISITGTIHFPQILPVEMKWYFSGRAEVALDTGNEWEGSENISNEDLKQKELETKALRFHPKWKCHSLIKS
jgi:hypothetical protein